MTTYIVASAAELTAALAKVTGGDRIELKGGNYGALNLSNKKFATDVTIAAQDPNNPPVFSTGKLAACSNVNLDGLKFNFVPNATTLEYTSALRVDGSSGISVVNSTFVGGVSVAGIDPNQPAGTQTLKGIMGWPMGRAMTFVNGSGVTIENNKITGFTDTVVFNRVSGIDFNFNDISGYRQTAVSGSQLSNVHVEGNYLHDPTPWKLGPKGDHGDFIHFWTTGKQTAASQNFVFLDNYLEQGKGAGTMGIFLQNMGPGFQNVLIEDNVIHTGNGQGLRLAGIVGGQILNNTILGHVGNPGVTPKIILAAGNKNIIIDKNVYEGVVLNNPANASVDKISFGQNVTAQWKNAAGADYVAKLVMNAFNTSPSMADFIAKVGSIADGLGAAIGSNPISSSVGPQAASMSVTITTNSMPAIDDSTSVAPSISKMIEAFREGGDAIDMPAGLEKAGGAMKLKLSFVGDKILVEGAGPQARVVSHEPLHLGGDGEHGTIKAMVHKAAAFEVPDAAPDHILALDRFDEPGVRHEGAAA